MHVHVPDWQANPDPQACPQAPQLLLSPPRLRQEPEQFVYSDWQVIPQLVPLHVALPFGGMAHGELHAVVPQLERPMLLTHVPLQSWVPAPHTHLLL